ncbi:MAG TPA: GntR family transcriptional regulator [Ktedonobacterales bacterium]|nr:GntR family transcriptional regulator [Ktedonobacterales bacterium]
MAAAVPGETPASDAQRLPTLTHMTKTAVAVEALRGAILRGDIAPDAPLTVGRIAQMLGMSPTPVREAIRTLQAEGLLRHEPHHSVSVTRYTAQDIHDLYQMRAELESQATRIATPRLDDATLSRLAALNERMRERASAGDTDTLNRLNGEWHLLIYGAADNRILLDVVQHLWKKFVWDINWILPGRSLRSIDEHDAVLDALRAHDADEAVRRMRAHLQYGEEYAVAYVEGKTASGDTARSQPEDTSEQTG